MGCDKCDRGRGGSYATCDVMLVKKICNTFYHRLRGSASPVLTATHHSYGSPRLSDIFPPLGSGGQTPQRKFTQNGSNDVFSRKDVLFAVKVATFHTP